MAQLLMSGQLIDLIVALIVAEAGLIVFLHRRNPDRPSPGDLFPNLISGAALMVAIKLALVAAPWYALAACLGVSLLAHLADLARRYRQTEKNSE